MLLVFRKRLDKAFFLFQIYIQSWLYKDTFFLFLLFSLGFFLFVNALEITLTDLVLYPNGNQYPRIKLRLIDYKELEYIIRYFPSIPLTKQTKILKETNKTRKRLYHSGGISDPTTSPVCYFHSAVIVWEEKYRHM